MTPAAPSILIVEDDPDLAARIAVYLERNGFSASIEGAGDRAAARIIAEQPSLVLLDLMLPGKDGLSICREVRAAYTRPIIIMTARGGETHEIEGLEIGADDYVRKPVRPRVLLARVRAALRRPAAETSDERLHVGELMIDPTTREVTARGEKLALTSGEFDLLFLLASHAGQVMSRKLILEQLRGLEHEDFDRSIDLRVSRLRQKLGEVFGPLELIKTVRGTGYLYAGR